jgi:hypothetical protein
MVSINVIQFQVGTYPWLPWRMAGQELHIYRFHNFKMVNRRGEHYAHQRTTQVCSGTCL